MIAWYLVLEWLASLIRTDSPAGVRGSYLPSSLLENSL
jgi:hypothetical protein